MPKAHQPWAEKMKIKKCGSRGVVESSVSDIELVKSKLDIVDVIGSYIELKNAGANLKAPCPFHGEKTPSFMVNPTLQIFKCFGCGRGGDVIRFIQEIERVDFPEAMKIAAEKAGVQLTKMKNSTNQKQKEKKERILQANELTAKYYQYILKTHPSGKQGRDYAAKRQIGAAEIEKFMFGYAPTGKSNLKKFLLSKGFNEKELLEFGLLVDRNGESIDKFRERLLQPVRDARGDVTGFSGRYFGQNEGAPKYLNSPETLVFKKQDLLYGIYEAANAIKKEKFVIIVEGNIDVVSSHRAGVENIVAPLGTAFTENQAKILKRYADAIYFCFDTDDAGLSALIRSLKIAEEQKIKHRVVDITGYHDTDDLVCKNPDEWKKRISENKNTIEYLITKFSEGLDLGKVEDKVELKARVIPVLRMLKNDVELSHFAKQVSLILEVTNDDFMKDIKSGEVIRSKKVYRPEIPLKTEDDESIRKAALESNRKQSKFEMGFLSLVVQNKTDFGLAIISEIFTTNELQELVEILKETNFKIDPIVLKALDPKVIELLELLSLTDITYIEKPEIEAKKLFKKIYIKYLDNQILKTRAQLAVDDENPEILQKQNDLLIEKRRVDKL